VTKERHARTEAPRTRTAPAAAAAAGETASLSPPVYGIALADRPKQPERPDDPEREANRVADEVVGGPLASVPVMRGLASIAGTVQAKPLRGEAATFSPPGLPARLASLGGSRSLSPSERAFFEPRFGERFADVRIHAGAAASEMARAIRARAFTFGRDIVLGAGQYTEGSRAGRRLLAHELTHTLQQARSRTSTIQRDPDPNSTSPWGLTLPSLTVPGTGITITPGPLRTGILGAAFPLPANLKITNPLGLGSPSFIAEIGPRAFLGQLLENVVLQRWIRPGTPPDRLTDPDAEAQIRLARPFVRIDPRTGRLSGMATLSIDSDYPRSFKEPTEVDVAIESSELGRFKGRLGYGPLQADLKLRLHYDTKRLEDAAKPAFAPEGGFAGFESAFRTIVRQTMPTVPFAASTEALKALYGAALDGKIDAVGFALQAIALLGNSVPSGTGLAELKKALSELFQELTHPGYDVSGTLRLFHVPITRFGARANTTRSGATSSSYAVGAIIAPPGAITSVAVPAFGGTYSYADARQRFAVTGALLPSLSLDAINRKAPVVNQFPVYAFAEVSYANKVSKSVELGVRLTIQTSSAEVFGAKSAPPTDPVERFNTTRDQYRSLKDGTDSALVPNAGITVFAAW